MQNAVAQRSLFKALLSTHLTLFSLFVFCKSVPNICKKIFFAVTENLPQKPWNSPCLPILFWSPPRFCRATWQNSTSSQFIWFRPLESTDTRRPSVSLSSRNGHHALVCQCHNAMFWSDLVSNVSSNVIFWHPIDAKKAIFPGKSQLALKLKLILCLMMRETTMTAERRVPKFLV